jgi:hypothetical protein
MQMAFLGLFKSKEERQLDGVIDGIMQVQGIIQGIIPHIENEHGPSQRAQIAQTAVDAIMRTPVTWQGVNSLAARVKGLTDVPNRQSDYLGNALASCLLKAWVAAGSAPVFQAGLGIQVALLEGSVLGFVERAGVPGWHPCYSLDPDVISTMQREYLRQHETDGAGIK